MSTPFLGEIKMFAGNFEIRGYAFCDGRVLPIAQNTALFAILGTTFGGNGTTNFGLPDLRGRFPMHWGNGPGLSLRSLGERAGEQATTLNTTQLPAHTHAFSANATPPCSSLAGNSDTPVGKVPAASATVENYAAAPGNATMAPISVSGTTGPSGGGALVPIMPPYLCVSFIIALQGIFPSRN